MSNFSDEYLLDLRSRAATELTTDVLCLFDRFSIPVYSGTAKYTLPDGILSIIQITYKGFKVDPTDYRTADEQGMPLDPLFADRTGRPLMYLQHNLGFNQLAFWPVPNEDIAADDTGIWDDIDEINARVIISCWRVADATHQLPDPLDRRLVKDYIGMKAYAKEGPTQQIDVANFYRQRYNRSKAHLDKVIRYVPKSITPLFQPNFPGQKLVARPVLPSNFGIKSR
jgi:hypothetical protein